MKRMVVMILALLLIFSTAEAEFDLSMFLTGGENVPTQLYVLENDYVEEIKGICFSIHAICTDGIKLYADYSCTITDANDAEVVWWDGLRLDNIDLMHHEKDTYYVSVWPIIDNYDTADAFDYEVIGNTVHYMTQGNVTPNRDYDGRVEQLKSDIHPEEYVTIHFRISIIKVLDWFTQFCQYDVFYDCPVTAPDYCRTFADTIKIDNKQIEFAFTYIETPFEIYLFCEDNDPSCGYFLFDAAGNVLTTRMKITREALQRIRESGQLFVAESR